MFEDGSLWRPPQMNPYAQGMPDELVDGGGGSSGRTSEEHANKKAGLTDGCVVVSFSVSHVSHGSHTGFTWQVASLMGKLCHLVFHMAGIPVSHGR